VVPSHRISLLTSFCFFPLCYFEGGPRFFAFCAVSALLFPALIQFGNFLIGIMPEYLVALARNPTAAIFISSLDRRRFGTGTFQSLFLILRLCELLFFYMPLLPPLRRDGVDCFFFRPRNPPSSSFPLAAVTQVQKSFLPPPSNLSSPSAPGQGSPALSLASLPRS